ncbi:hypothetical protein VTH06DRAFT_4938 [Thermothelomyces fergusii]
MDQLDKAIGAVRRAAESLGHRQPGQPSAGTELDSAVAAAWRVLDDHLESLRRAPLPPAAGGEAAWGALGRVVKAAELVLSLVPANQRFRPLFLCLQSAAFGCRFAFAAAAAAAGGGNPRPDPADLVRSLGRAWEVVATLPSGENASDRRRAALDQLGRILERQGMSRPSVADPAHTVHDTGADDDVALVCLVKVVKLLTWLFEAAADTDLLDAAVAVAEVGAAGRRQLGLNTLARALGLRFEARGAAADLDRAIALLDGSLPSLREGDRDLAIGRDYLAILLGMRFEEQGDASDLDEAVKWSRAAVDGAPPSDPDRPRRLQNLANRLAARGLHTGDVADLDRAIRYAQEGLDAVPPDHRERAKWLGNLATFLGMRYKLSKQHRTDGTADLHRIASIASKAIRLARWHGDLPLARALTNTLANVLREKHRLEGDSSYLDEAVRVLEEALSPPAGLGGHEQALLWHCLGETLKLRYEHTGAVRDSEEAMRAYERVLDSELARPSAHALLAEIRRQPGFERFLLPPTAEQMMAAAEPGPIVVANVSPIRCDAFLVEHDRIRVVPLPNLDQESVVRASDRLHPWGPSSPDSLQATLKWLWESLVRPALDALGFTGKPGPGSAWPRVWWVPVGPLSGLPLHAAGDHGSHGPVHNHHHHHDNDVDEEEEEREEDDEEEEGEKPDTAIDRVMSSYSSSIKAIIAGRFSAPVPPAALPRLPVSLWTPLLFPDLLGRSVLVSMSSTPGYGRLEFTDREVDMLTNLCWSLSLRPDRPPSLTRDEVLRRLHGCRVFHFAGHGISDPVNPSHSRLLLEDWMDHPLTVDDLHRERLLEARHGEREWEEDGEQGTADAGGPFLAYLSACSTAANEKMALSDEVIHLASTCQLAGFRHVVGTLWTVPDAPCAEIARHFYAALRDGRAVDDHAVCRALHFALREIRDGCRSQRAAIREAADRPGAATDTVDRGAQPVRRKRVNLLWVPYVHFGV